MKRALLLLALLSTTGCRAVVGIFKMGVISGVLFVIFILAVFVLIGMFVTRD